MHLQLNMMHYICQGCSVRTRLLINLRAGREGGELKSSDIRHDALILMIVKLNLTFFYIQMMLHKSNPKSVQPQAHSP